MSAETIGSAAADADAAPLDLLLTDAALGVLTRVNPGGSGLRLAAALAARPRLVASRTRNLPTWRPRRRQKAWPRTRTWTGPARNGSPSCCAT
jgi:hypothetical protein